MEFWMLSRKKFFLHKNVEQFNNINTLSSDDRHRLQYDRQVLLAVGANRQLITDCTTDHLL